MSRINLNRETTLDIISVILYLVFLGIMIWFGKMISSAYSTKSTPIYTCGTAEACISASGEYNSYYDSKGNLFSSCNISKQELIK